MKRMLLVLVTILLIVSCKSQKKTGNEESGEGADMPSLSLIASDLYGGAEEEVFEVIRDQASLQKFYRKVNMTRKPGLPVPQIDFSKNMAVLYCSGSTNDIELPEMYISEQNDKEMYLEKAKFYAKDSTVQSTATVTPFGLYLLPLTDKQVIFSQK
ncbi:MAG: hypothetical protein KJO04_05075 [Bacteroidia bacterium]|nr:hypothetical protein [Bacteroidia bacterium]